MLNKIRRYFTNLTKKDRTIRKTLLLFLAVFFVAAIALFYLITTDILTSAALEREGKQALGLRVNAERLIVSGFDYVHDIAKDWAQRESVYRGMTQNDADALTAVGANLADFYGFDLVVAVGANGAPLYQTAGDQSIFETTKLRELTEAVALSDKQSFDLPYGSQGERLAGQSGLSAIGGTVYFLSSHPVTAPDSAVYAGSLLFGVALDYDALASVLYDSDYLLWLADAQTPALSEAMAQAIDHNGVSIELDKTTRSLTAYTLINDLFGNPSILMTIENWELSGMTVHNTALTFLLPFTLILALFLLAAYVILEYFVLRPIHHLDGRIGTADSLPKPGVTPLIRFKEFAALNSAVDRLMQKMDKDDQMINDAKQTLDVLSQVIDSVTDEMILFDDAEMIEFANPSARRNLGSPTDSLIGRDLSVLIAPQQKEFFHNVLTRLDENPVWQGELIFRSLEGETAVSKATITPIFSPEGPPERFVLIKRSLEDVRHYELQINHIEHHDHLTGLPNRAYFYKRVSEAIAAAEATQTKAVVFYIDIDRFKDINDTMGHGMGDKLIQLIAARFTQQFSDQFFVARMGGDEFALIQTDVTDSFEAEKLANRILLTLSRPFLIEDEECTLSASIGSSLYPDNAAEVENILKNADEAMYHAKQLGRNRYCAFSEQIHQDIIRRVSMENNLRLAAVNGCTDFVPYFQPKVDARTKRIVGSEALIRWVTPGGLINPAEFIPIAEETGLICQISRYMLIEACKDNRQLYDCGINISVSVNISCEVLLNESFVGMIQDALQISGIHPEQLDIEITEGTLMADVEQVNTVLAKIRGMGVTITVDDFGTGYSSLSYLKKFYVNRLKIDKAFITGLPESRDDLALVNAILTMAKSLNILVTAEGVETETQFTHLMDLDCEEIQGFYISEPMPFDDFFRFAKEWQNTTSA